jgi:hypothetical protein
VPALLTVNTFADLPAPAGGLLSLRAALAQAADPATHPGADTIDLPQMIGGVTGTYALTLGELKIDDATGPLGIEAIGGPATVDAQKVSRVFEVTAVSNVRFDWLTITGGSTNVGGGIYNFGTTSIVGSTLNGNSAVVGGGVYNSGGTVTVILSTLTGNSAFEGGGLENFASGAVTITASTLSGNSGFFDGGGLENYIGGTVTITASTLGGNLAGIGAGIYNYGTVTLTTSTLSDNAAVFFPVGRGGGILNFAGGTVTITASTLSGNSAGNGSGGGVFNDANATANITVSTLSGNSADVGGGLSNLGTATVTGCTIAANLATNVSNSGGGGAFNSGTMTLKDTAVTDNKASLYGGGIFTVGTMTLTAGTLGGNSAGLGGGIENDGTATLTNITVTNNKASVAGGGGAGGGIRSVGTLSLVNGSVVGNTATSASGGIANRGTLTMTGGTVAGNSAAFNGGFSNNGDGTATLTGVTITGNTATSAEGGGIGNFFPGATLTLIGCTVAGNTAVTHAGGIGSSGTLVLTNCTVTGNKATGATGDGGGIWADDGKVTVGNTTVAGNSAAHNGGGIWTGPPATLTVTASTLSGNVAVLVGGGIYDEGTVTIATSTLVGNSATEGGGILNDGTVTFIASTLSGNSAIDGGGIRNDGTVTLTASTLYGNLATYGGGIDNYLATATLTITASTLSGNSADTGGGINNFFGQLTLTGSTLSDNSAAFGGGIFNWNGVGTAKIRNTIIATNRASNSGPDVSGDFSSLGYNIIGIGNGGTGFVAVGDQAGTAASPIDPKLGPLQNNGGPTFTRALLAGSPALNVGDPSLAGTADQRGVLRPQGGGVDIGAFENRPPTVSAFTKVGGVNNPLTFAATDFTSHFQVGDGNALTAVKIVSLPPAASGVLKLNGVAVAASQVIAAADLNKVVFVPARAVSGAVTFQYTASDGISFAPTPATITLQILSAAQQAAALQAQVDALLAAGVLNQGQANSLKVKLDLKGNNGDAGKVQSFLNEVAAYRNAAILTQSQADALTAAAAVLLVSVS